jgi:hypothetical protein
MSDERYKHPLRNSQGHKLAETAVVGIPKPKIGVPLSGEMARPNYNPDQGAGGNLNFAHAMLTSDPQAIKRAKEVVFRKVSTEFPRNSHAPEGSQTLDLRRLVEIPASTPKILLFDFTASPGAENIITHYGLFSDAESLTRFFIERNGKAILPYHGNPALPGNAMNLALGPDLENDSLIQAEIWLEPGDTVQIFIENNNTVETFMGARIKGYVDTTSERTTRRGGG